ncbi:ABC transporter permease [Chitinophaga oryzae]|uniref:ABC transporter permease n=1 Tax=Chitinophaga oryzae TaxID=2725414 RepID=A0AAE6ZCE5_9BACT|nr:ABC transporter permease [Chitinophaga oryzae]QJB30131.1 ABC transporter permease [Chitinophaga oryzae]QJB36629.1 ABC transporter permease [Chitinophaga oryzae]
MLKNYFKTAWRSLINHKAYSALNIFGLAIGMAVALLIGLWVFYQFSYDRFLPGYRNTAQVMYRTLYNGDILTQRSTAYPLAEVLKKEVPGVQYVAQTDWTAPHGLVAKEKKLYLNGVTASPDFLNVFSYPLLRGKRSDALNDMHSIVLTASTAKSLFGEADPINQIVRLDNQIDLKVTAILQDVPANSTFQFHYIIPLDYGLKIQQWGTRWGNNNIQTFVSLGPHASFDQVSANMKTLLKKYSVEEYRITKAEVFMQPMKQWHLQADFKNGVVSGGLLDYVKMFSLIGLLVLLIACINFMNLSTARSEKRAREVGIRKAVGSHRKDLIFQFLIESLMITLFSFVLSLLLVQLSLPAFNSLTGSAIRVPYDNAVFWCILAAYVLLTALLAGGRPAFYLSSFQPVKVLKGSVHTGKAATLPRKALVILQFTCSVALMISTIVIYQQIQHAKDRPTGYNAQRLLMTDNSPDMNRNYEALKNALLQTGVVSSVTKSSSPVTGIWVTNNIREWQGKQPGESMELGTTAVSDADYFKTMGMEIIAGRNFTGVRSADSACMVLNETAVRRMRLKDPVGQTIRWNQPELTMKVIGVVKDALMGSPYSSVPPCMFLYNPDWANVITYRLEAGVPTAKALAALTPVFNKYNPFYSYKYQFVNDAYADKFRFETLVGNLAGVFAALAIFISCLGLFGLAAYMAEQRTKEIGIRKVLGASISQVWLLLSKDFVALVMLSCIMAAPVTWYLLQRWLQQYEYRINIGAGVWLTTALMAIVITIVTVSFQSVRAALANPVKSLRAE